MDALRARGILMVEYAHGTIRAVTHYGVTADDIERVLSACAAALRETTPTAAATMER
jgi:threonine aldolase